MTMRVYVLYPHSRRQVLIPLLALWLGAIVVGCVRVLPQWRIAYPMTDKATKSGRCSPAVSLHQVRRIPYSQPN